MKKQRVIAAIDFGTHGTGFAWTTIDDRHKDPKRRQVWFRTRWPNHPTPYPKNLSAILLSRDGELVAWGYEARRKWAAISARGDASDYDFHLGFKMSLSMDAKPESEEITGGRLGYDKSKKLATIFLDKMRSTAMEEISKSGYSSDEVRWCLTVPAIWDDYQKQLMWEAAVAAGLPDDERRLQLVIEPEAAAYHARVSGVRTINASGRRASLMSKGSRFLVADCGGGTVDITAYKTDSRNRLEEIGRECGGKFGSEYVNQAFLERVLAKRLGSYDVVDKIGMQSPAAIIDLMDSWEKAKVSITKLEDDDIYLPIPAALDRLLDSDARDNLVKSQDGIVDFLVVTAQEAREVFEAVVPGILGLVDKQLDEMRLQRRNSPGKELVILVGGFGNSPYLQERLQEHLDGRADVLVPPDPQVAVLLGAVHYTYDPQTKSRRTKYTYGCAANDTFREGIDPADHLIVLPDGERRCNNRFSRYVQVGQSVPVDELVTHTFYPLYEDQKQIEFKIYSSPGKYPTYVTEEGCRLIGKLTVDLSDAMKLPRDQRAVRLSFVFGEVKMKVMAVVAKTGKFATTNLDFTPLN
ncbi:HSP70 family protein [Streptomyces sp. OfavH-34-F]|uniref:Hsp70 family protein n=1 Tax=Streptomyces sp. OfavH-34-F TaxID=2917760 RepID=UPI001EF2C9C1|nr:Hsp70 family protein [Streptomyces sp. OfavH-34-F]MCG7524332.1 HSP70 family protein [Streptomyces sp. OfavH-34-F]